MTGAGCSACGDCCDPVWYPMSPGDVRQGAVTATGPAGVDLAFAAAHWTFTGERRDDRYGYACDRFDRATRRCAAHDERPPVCRGFPWYGERPSIDLLLPARCAYRADLA